MLKLAVAWFPLPDATVDPVVLLVNGTAAAQVTPTGFPQVAVTELTGGVLQPVKFAAPATA
jgi:hypothetical protein